MKGVGLAAASTLDEADPSAAVIFLGGRPRPRFGLVAPAFAGGALLTGMALTMVDGSRSGYSLEVEVA